MTEDVAYAEMLRDLEARGWIRDGSTLEMPSHSMWLQTDAERLRHWPGLGGFLERMEARLQRCEALRRDDPALRDEWQDYAADLTQLVAALHRVVNSLSRTKLDLTARTARQDRRGHL